MREPRQCPGGSSFVARERIEGALDGHEGTFVLEHRGSMSEGHPVVMEATVVQGSGTGALTGITGSGHVAHEVLTLDLGLPTGEVPPRPEAPEAGPVTSSMGRGR